MRGAASGRYRSSCVLIRIGSTSVPYMSKASCPYFGYRTPIRSRPAAPRLTILVSDVERFTAYSWPLFVAASGAFPEHHSERVEDRPVADADHRARADD